MGVVGEVRFIRFLGYCSSCLLIQILKFALLVSFAVYIYIYISLNLQSDMQKYVVMFLVLILALGCTLKKPIVVNNLKPTIYDVIKISLNFFFQKDIK